MQKEEKENLTDKNISQKKIQTSENKDLKNFSLYLDDKDKDMIFSYIKFDIKKMFPNKFIKEKENFINGIDKEIENEIMESLNGQKKIENEENEKMVPIFQNFKIYDSINVSVKIFPDLIYQSKNSFDIKVEIILEIENLEKLNWNGQIEISSRGFSSKQNEKLFVKDTNFNISAKKCFFSFISTEDIEFIEDNKVFIEICFENRNALCQKKGLSNGLINLGVTCYMNSFIQTIFHISKFREFINKLPNKNDSNNFIFALQHLFYLMEKLDNIPVKPDMLIKSFGWNLKQMLTQQDVTEFSFIFLDAIEKKCKESNIKEDITKILFEGKLESYIKCVNIEFESVKEEIFTDVQLIIKQKNNIYQSLKFFLEKQKLFGTNAYQTEKNGKQDAEKGIRFKTLPSVLNFQLNRFDYDYNFNMNIKIKENFEFYEKIYLGDLVKEKKQDQNYKLFAVYAHFGSQSGAGHYKVFINKNNKWLEFDDEFVQEVNFDYVKHHSFGGKIKDIVIDLKNFCLREKIREAEGHAYMLVYVRENEWESIIGDYDGFYHENIKEVGNRDIKFLREEEYKRTHFCVYLMDKKTFLGKETGFGGIFYRKYQKDENVLNHFRDGEFKTLEFNLKDSEKFIIDRIEREMGLGNKKYSLFYFCCKYNKFRKLEIDSDFEFYDDFNYFFVDLESNNFDENKILLSIQEYDYNKNILKVLDINLEDKEITFNELIKKRNLPDDICLFYKKISSEQILDFEQRIEDLFNYDEGYLILIKSQDENIIQNFKIFYHDLQTKMKCYLYYNNKQFPIILRMGVPVLENIKTIKKMLKIDENKKILLRYSQGKKGVVCEKERNFNESDNFDKICHHLRKVNKIGIDIEPKIKNKLKVILQSINGHEIFPLEIIDDYKEISPLEVLNYLKKDENFKNYINQFSKVLKNIGLYINDFECFRKTQEFYEDINNFEKKINIMESNEFNYYPSFRFTEHEDEDNTLKKKIEFFFNGKRIFYSNFIFYFPKKMKIRELIESLKSFATLINYLQTKKETIKKNTKIFFEFQSKINLETVPQDKEVSILEKFKLLMVVELPRQDDNNIKINL